MWVANIIFGNKEYNSHEIGAFYGELRERTMAVQTGRDMCKGREIRYSTVGWKWFYC